MTNSIDETNSALVRKCPLGKASIRWPRISYFGSSRPAVLLSLIIILACAQPAHATPTQEDVFKSISSNVDDKIDGRKLLGFCAAVAGGITLLVVINNRQQRVEQPTVTNHQGKLLRELMKAAGLKSSQIRQLKAISADLTAKGQPVENLTTLLLCPSLIKKAKVRGGAKR